MKHQGSCHCGKIAFEVEGDISEAYDCNCSMCRRRGGLLWFAPRAALVLKTPESDLSTYTFNKHHIQHHFCATCGISPYGEGDNPKSGPMAAVNVRCLPDVDLSSLKIVPIDGASR
ncbi:aldehyde-activating protein [Pseudoxanthomonas yeongjuensis]|uniref:GFA family protein n=1 Tax=Pseudoxanthomonas yeongjuensis TaxID=377616 RepID=UPI001391D87F|nr:GFA family protein [Pseudoxanthomonas yeongjuensis]KAF1714392.1 aldehyde-activating protein [Pseudoxanthomonas yeongjuensis]